jgi:hypothetical protein
MSQRKTIHRISIMKCETFFRKNEENTKGNPQCGRTDLLNKSKDILKVVEATVIKCEE